MLKLIKRPDSPNWQIEGTCIYKEQFVRKSTKTPIRTEAAAILTKENERRREEALHGHSGSAYWVEAMNEYLAKGGKERFLDPMLEYFGRMRLRDIKDTDLSAFCVAQYPSVKSSTLVRQAYAPFQAIWNAASRAEMCHQRTFAKPRVVRAQIRYPADDIWLMDLLKRGLTNDNQKACAMFMSFSGRRVTETVDILVEHFRPDRAEILIPKTKNGKAVVVALPAFVVAVLSQLDLRDPKARLFGYSTRFSVTNFLKRGCARAGIEYFSPHRMGRHRFAARFLEGGNSLKALQMAGGWDSIGAVDKYSHIEVSSVHDAVRNVNAPDELVLLHTCSTKGDTASVLHLEDTDKKGVID